MSVIKNQKKGLVTLHFVANSGSIVIAGNSSQSNVATATENVVGATIRTAMFSSNGFWTLKRGANTVAILHGTGTMDFAGHGMLLALDKTAAFSANVDGAGFIMVELVKESKDL